MSFVVARATGQLVTGRIHHSPSYTEEYVRQFDTFEQALKVAEDMGNGSVCKVVPVAKVTTEFTKHTYVDPLL